MEEKKNVCALCNIVAKQRCSACHAVYYCSQEHQKSHWKSHSKDCRAYKLLENDQIGRHYVATRNIKVGEPVIHDKTALVAAPGHPRAMECSDCDFHLSLATPPVCLSCYIELEADFAKPCRKCGWPLCSKCTEHGSECEFTIKHRKSRVNISKRDYGLPHPAYEIIGVIRALALRENDPEAYRKLMNLQDHSTKEREADTLDAIGTAARYAKTFLKMKRLKIEEICKIIRIILGNSVETSSKHHVSYASVYDHSSYIEHNCRANCAMSTTTEGGIVFWAAMPIAKGEHITTCYANSLWSTIKRRKFLSTTKFFDCNCERCKDPTEFGTMLDAVYCTRSDCNGPVLPPADLEPGGKNVDYVCRSCNETVPWQLIEMFEERYCLDMATLQTTDIDQCQKFIRKWRGYFPETSHYILEVELAMASAIFDVTRVPQEHLTYVVNLLTKLTKLLQTLAPAEHAVMVKFMYQKFQADQISKMKESFTLEEELAFVQGYAEGLSEVEELLNREPSGFSFDNWFLKSLREDFPKLKEAGGKLVAVGIRDSLGLDCIIQ